MANLLSKFAEKKRALIGSLLIIISSAAIARSGDPVDINLQRLLTTLSCPGCNLQGVDLSHQDLSNANLAAADLTGADLSDTNLRGANLSHAILRHATLVGAKLSGADMTYADLSDLDIDESFESMEIIGTRLEGARFKYGVVCGKAPKKGGWGCQHR